jgi:hypothetical protein
MDTGTAFASDKICQEERVETTMYTSNNLSIMEGVPSATHRIQEAWGNGISEAAVTKNLH